MSRLLSVTLLLLLALVLVAGRSHALAPGQWALVGQMNTARDFHTATLLPDGKVLAAGGLLSGGDSAEIYDIETEVWTPTAGMSLARAFHTATLLGNEMVLVAGGYNSVDGSVASAELYNPVTGQWSATGSMNTARDSHTATLLPDGRVLVVGGYGNSGLLDSAEVYDPDTGQWSATGSMGTTRALHIAVPLETGMVLVAGGSSLDGMNNTVSLASAELYDPFTGTWSPTGAMGSRRTEFAASLLASGAVLVAGGDDRDGTGSLIRLASAEIYDPVSGTWGATGSMSVERAGLTLSMLLTGEFVAIGGVSCCDSLASTELYNPETGEWTLTGSMSTGHFGHTATPLSNLDLLVAGGQDTNFVITPVTEVYEVDLSAYLLLGAYMMTQINDPLRYVNLYTTYQEEAIATFRGDMNLVQGGAEVALEWSPLMLGYNFRTLGGNDTVTAEQMGVLQSFLEDFQAASSPELAQVLQDEADRLPDYDHFIGMTVDEVVALLIASTFDNDGKVYVPLLVVGN